MVSTNIQPCRTAEGETFRSFPPQPLSSSRSHFLHSAKPSPVLPMQTTPNNGEQRIAGTVETVLVKEKIKAVYLSSWRRLYYNGMCSFYTFILFGLFRKLRTQVWARTQKITPRAHASMCRRKARRAIAALPIIQDKMSRAQNFCRRPNAQSQFSNGLTCRRVRTRGNEQGTCKASRILRMNFHTSKIHHVIQIQDDS